jgi:hypothetical protein
MFPKPVAGTRLSQKVSFAIRAGDLGCAGGVKGCLAATLASTSGVPEIAADLSRRPTRQPRATSGLPHRGKQAQDDGS